MNLSLEKYFNGIIKFCFLSVISSEWHCMTSRMTFSRLTNQKAGKPSLGWNKLKVRNMLENCVETALCINHFTHALPPGHLALDRCCRQVQNIVRDNNLFMFDSIFFCLSEWNVTYLPWSLLLVWIATITPLILQKRFRLTLYTYTVKLRFIAFR